MPEIVTARGTAYQLERIIKEARERLVLISAYWQVHPHYMQMLKDAADRGVPITIIYRTDSIKKVELEALARLKGARFGSVAHLHAKCFHNESKLVLGSMNLYDHSERNNHELGVTFFLERTPVPFAEAVREAASIIGAASLFSFPLVGTLPDPWPYVGHCITCGALVPFRPGMPFCALHSSSIQNLINDFDPQEFCHRCGSRADTSEAKPEDYDCYQRSEYERLSGLPSA